MVESGVARVRWVTFDCYGTLVDWRHGIMISAELVAPGHGERLLGAYERHEPRVQEEAPGMRYRRVLAEAFGRACREVGVDVIPDDLSVPAATLPYWRVYPEVTGELGALREAGWNLALLTNCDRDLVAETLRRLAVPFDMVVTAEDSGAYKPAPAHFERFRAAHRPEAGHWVHVAQSYYHDMLPAARLGIPRIWINRRDERPDDPSVVPEIAPDLAGLAARVAKVAQAAQGPAW
ncbi:2-haloacid dehalogenase [Thermocatellispora tengchongensis]|uniref:2-haloacid dehalogenase n=1 Tax=Thermocatellispora tengchongensis TaxID=1073253 RepID=A0A840PDM0_9ACTN|nr:HAD family hydrolase [Thermocatellispora tengchongensis]MBB5136033.1 2-haloacid dehalogenase [Thermocatellispora tengchongensis]